MLALYIFNLIVVSVDFALYFINKHREKSFAQETPNDAKKAPRFHSLAKEA